MKLIIQIPCFNEEKTLPFTLKALPNYIKGIEKIETLIIDDGSSDSTAEVAKKCGVDHIIRFDSNRGLGQAFNFGIKKSVELGADIVVNTDADNQYRGSDIEKLVKPILEGKSDLVIGCRPIKHHPEFSFIKKLLQFTGSWVMRKISGANIPDAASGFRAFTKNACLRLNIHSNFSHCMETLIQASASNIRYSWVKIDVNPKQRESRLFKSILHYIWNSGKTILAVSFYYNPTRLFTFISIIFIFPSIIIGLRFIYLVYIQPFDGDRSYIPSLILLSILGGVSTVCLGLALIGEFFKVHRRINEQILFEIKSLSLNKNKYKDK